MPALVLCGQRTFLAGDDLLTFTACAIVFRVLQLVCLVPLTIKMAQYGDGLQDIDEIPCPEEDTNLRLVTHAYLIFLTYIIAAWALTFVGLVIEIGIWRTTSKGAPTQSELRWYLKPLCYTKMVPISLFRWGVLAVSVLTFLVIDDYCRCGDDPTIYCPQYYNWITWITILFVSHLIEAIVVAFFSIYFGCKAKPRIPNFLDAETKWRMCCRCCCTFSSILTCCLAGGRDTSRGNFADIAVILADFFESDGVVDVVASDIIVGFKMLARVQKQRQLECRQDTIRRCSVMDLGSAGHDTRGGGGERVDEELGEAKHVPEPLIAEEDGSREGDDEVEDTKDEELGEAKHVSEPLIAEEDGSREGDDEVEDTQDEELGEAKHVPEPLIAEEDSSRNGDDEVADTKSHTSSESSSFDIGEIDPHLAELILSEDVQINTPMIDGTINAAREASGRRGSVVYQMRRRGGNVYYKPTERPLLSRQNAVDKLAIAQGARFMRFAWGIYVFKQFEYKGHQWFERARDARDEMLGARVHESRLLAAAGLDHVEIVYAQFQAGLATTPYAIAIDHDWKSVVVTIRGTLSLDDVVADLTMRPSSMEEWGERCGFDGQNCYVHQGVLGCAEWIYNDLERHKWLDKLLIEEGSRAAGYQLVLTGHSLGAGCAATLSFMLKSKFPSLTCLAFSPPGCTLSLKMADSCKDYLTSYVLESDIVPRLSLDAMEHLRDDINEMVARIRIPKYQASNKNRREGDVGTLLHRKGHIPPSKFRDELNEFKARQKERRSEDLNIPLYPPGRIIQLVKTEAEQPTNGCFSFGCCAKDVDLQEHSPCTARWIQREDLAEIVISSTFMEDHSSPNVLQELERIAEVFDLSSPFKTDDQSAVCTDD